MLYGSETWCLGENEMSILRRTERGMVRAMWGSKLMAKKRTEDGDVRIEGDSRSECKGEWSEMVRGMYWGGMMDTFWEKHWSFKWGARGSQHDQRRHGKCKWRRRARVLEKKDAMNQVRWRVGVREIAAGVNPTNPLYGNKPKLVWWWYFQGIFDNHNHFSITWWHLKKTKRVQKNKTKQNSIKPYRDEEL